MNHQYAPRTSPRRAERRKGPCCGRDLRARVDVTPCRRLWPRINGWQCTERAHHTRYLSSAACGWLVGWLVRPSATRKHADARRARTPGQSDINKPNSFIINGLQRHYNMYMHMYLILSYRRTVVYSTGVTAAQQGVTISFLHAQERSQEAKEPKRLLSHPVLWRRVASLTNNSKKV